MWTPSDGLSCSNCPQPVFSSSAGSYSYTLVITYNQECTVSDIVRVFVQSQHRVYVPNSFTPNNDGVNDVFYAYPVGAKYFNIVIYDRWGEKVFESNDEGQGWDGRYMGALMDPGIYVYMMNLTFNDNYTVHNKGSITLIR